MSRPHLSLQTKKGKKGNGAHYCSNSSWNTGIIASTWSGDWWQLSSCSGHWTLRAFFRVEESSIPHPCYKLRAPQQCRYKPLYFPSLNSQIQTFLSNPKLSRLFYQGILESPFLTPGTGTGWRIMAPKEVFEWLYFLKEPWTIRCHLYSFLRRWGRSKNNRPGSLARTLSGPQGKPSYVLSLCGICLSLLPTPSPNMHQWKLLHMPAFLT